MPYYILSCAVMRAMTLPETLNGETGLICILLKPKEFRKKQVNEIIEQAKRKNISILV